MPKDDTDVLILVNSLSDHEMYTRTSQATARIIRQVRSQYYQTKTLSFNQQYLLCTWIAQYGI